MNLPKPQHPYFGIRPWKRHSLVLMVAGFAYIAIGITYIRADLSPTRAHNLVVALRWLSIDDWGTIWIMAGILSVISSRWPPIAETWGYMVLTALSAGWSATYALGIVTAHTGMDNLSSTVVWALVAFMWWAISGLVNPDRTGAQLGPG